MKNSVWIPDHFSGFGVFVFRRGVVSERPCGRERMVLVMVEVVVVMEEVLEVVVMVVVVVVMVVVVKKVLEVWGCGGGGGVVLAMFVEGGLVVEVEVL